MKRRDWLKAILAAGIAPAVVKAESLMRVKELPSGLVVPDGQITLEDIQRATAMLKRNCIPHAYDCYNFQCHPESASIMSAMGKNAGETIAKLITDVYET